MTTRLVVLIAACGQPAVLQRTLASLTVCEKPPGFGGVTVVENGPRCGLQAVVASFAAEHGFRYLYSELPNKSLALNQALREIGDALVVFTDDDVVVPTRTLVVYSEAAAYCRGGEFYGGPIIPEYEADPPPLWLKPLLPRSAAGWGLAGSEKTPITQPEFIGPNMAAFAADVLRVGGFDTRLGPGRHMLSPGEDTEIQERLLASGIRGYYVPDAAMRHVVRRGCASIEFAIHRAERNGVYWGISQSRQSGFYPRRWLKIYGQWVNDRWRIRRWLRGGDEVLLTRAACLEARWRGRWQGLRISRDQAWSRRDSGSTLQCHVSGTSLAPARN